jgi:hypothetical protein
MSLKDLLPNRWATLGVEVSCAGRRVWVKGWPVLTGRIGASFRRPFASRNRFDSASVSVRSISLSLAAFH